MSVVTEKSLNDAMRRVVETWQGDHPDPAAAKAYADALAAHEWDVILEERGRLRQAEHEARTMSRVREEELREMAKAAQRLHVEVDMLLAHGPLTMTEEAERELRTRSKIRMMPELSAVLVELDKLREVYGARDSRLRGVIDRLEGICEAGDLLSPGSLARAVDAARKLARGES
jgi:hypothetical protein